MSTLKDPGYYRIKDPALNGFQVQRLGGAKWGQWIICCDRHKGGKGSLPRFHATSFTEMLGWAQAHQARHAPRGYAAR